MLGVLLVDKPSGISSHDVVNDIRRRFGTRRVGHAGTLDPLATGVLVVAVGPATRFLQYLPLEPKTYVADVRFGQSTETYDREGKVTQERPAPNDLKDALERVRGGFLGLVQQVPPMHSAIKVKGKPLYSYARKGQEIAREARTVHISEFEVLECEGARAKIKIVCSGGTYIRTIANDLGERIGCGAHLEALVRTAVGKFDLGMSIPLANTTPSMLISLAEALPPMPIIDMDPEQTHHILEGRQVRIEGPPSNFLVALRNPSGMVFSVARLLGNVLQPECVIPGEAVLDPS